MADVGIRGEQAGTTLRGGLVQLLKPAEKTAKMMESMGIQVTDANGKFIGLAGVIREFQESMKGMTDTQKLATLSQIVGTEAASGFLALMKAGPSEIEKMTKALENSGGASKEAAEQMMGGIGGALEELSGAFETLSILIGSQLAPYIQTFATWLSGLIQRFNEASPAVQKFVAIGLALTAGLTGLIAVLGATAAGIGFMITGIMPLISAIAQAGGVTALLSGALAFLANPITLTIAGITALVAAFAFAYSQFEGFRNVINSVFSTLLTFVQPALTAVTTFIREQISALSEWWRQIWPDLSLAFMNIWNGIVAFITPILNTILALFKFVWPAIEYIIKSVWENIKGVIEGAIAVITGIIQAFSALFTGNWDALWNAIKQIVSGAIEFVWNLFNLLLYGRLLKAGTALLNGLKAVFSAGWNAIKTNTSKVFTSIWNFLKNIWNSTVNFLKNALNGIRATFMNVFNAVRSFVSNVFSNIRTIISNAVKSMRESVRIGLDAIKNFFKSKFEQIKNLLKNVDLKSVGKNIISGLARGISSMAGAVISAVTDIAGKIKNKFLSFFNIHSPSRVMRDEVGRHIGTGVAEGIKRSTKTAVAAAKSQSKAISEAIKNLEVKFDTKKISARTYINELEKIRKNYKLTGDQARKISREIFQANQLIKKQAEERSKVINSINTKVKSANDKFLSKVKSINDKLKKDIDAAKKDFQEKLTSLTESIYNQVGLFDSVNTKRVNPAKLLHDLKAQNAQMKQFQSDLAKLQKMGVSKAFVDELRAMGVSAANEIHAIVNMPKTMLNEYVNAWRDKHALAAKEANIQMADERAALAKQIKNITAAAKVEIQKAKTEWIANLKKIGTDVAKLGSFRNSGRVLGQSTVQGLINGLRSMKGELQNTTKSIANVITQTIKKTLGIHSPSRVMIGLAKFVSLGVVKGIESMRNKVVKTTEKLSEWMTPDVPSVSLAYSTPNGVYGSLSSAVNGTVNVDSRDEILAAAIDRLERSLDGMTIVMDGERVGHLVRGYVNEGNAVDATIRRYFG